MALELMRDAQGRIVLPGTRVVRYSVDFTTGAAIPSWLTVTTTGSGTATVSGGKLVLATPGGTTATVQLAAPTVADTAVAAMKIECEGWVDDANSTDTQTYMGLTTYASITGNSALGAVIHQPNTTNAASLRHTIGDWPVTLPIRIDTNRADRRGTARTNRGLILLPASKQAFAMEDGYPMLCRTMSNMVSGSIGGLVAMASGNVRVTPAQVTIDKLTVEYRYL